MKKQLKIFSLILTIILTLGILPVSAAPPRATARYELPFEMNVASCILVSLDTGEVIFEKN
ncbi:MAG: hypothetical protein RR162_08585, partial [Oscillospiraceae bacterium]